MKVVTAAEANRQFSKILRQASEGETILVTSHGRTVARILPPEDEDADRARRVEAMHRFLELGRRRPVPDVGRWTREELYEDEPYPDTF